MSFSLTNREQKKRRRGVPIGTVLENMADELDDWHPAPGTHMHSTNDLDVVFRNTMHPDSPPGVDHMAIRHGRLGGA
jgi:hypothetical protein